MAETGTQPRHRPVQQLTVRAAILGRGGSMVLDCRPAGVFRLDADGLRSVLMEVQSRAPELLAQETGQETGQ